MECSFPCNGGNPTAELRFLTKNVPEFRACFGDFGVCKGDPWVDESRINPFISSKVNSSVDVAGRRLGLSDNDVLTPRYLPDSHLRMKMPFLCHSGINFVALEFAILLTFTFWSNSTLKNFPVAAL